MEKCSILFIFLLVTGSYGQVHHWSSESGSITRTINGVPQTVTYHRDSNNPTYQIESNTYGMQDKIGGNQFMQDYVGGNSFYGRPYPQGPNGGFQNPLYQQYPGPQFRPFAQQPPINFTPRTSDVFENDPFFKQAREHSQLHSSSFEDHSVGDSAEEDYHTFGEVEPLWESTTRRVMQSRPSGPARPVRPSRPLRPARPERPYRVHATDQPPSPAKECNLDWRMPNPDSQCCGVDSVSVNNVFGGETASLEEFPWLVGIEYYNATTNKTGTYCGGFLVSGLYVITAAHCTVGEVEEVGAPVNVILGDYNNKNEGPDCIDQAGVQKCNDGAIRIPIDSIETHKDHEHNSHTNIHDIAIIKMKTVAPFSNFIRPICLPTVNRVNNTRSGMRLIAAGWGSYKQEKYIPVLDHYSPIKRRVNLPIRNLQECKGVYGNFIGKGHICAGGESGKDTCRGDSGTPLMYDNDGVFEAVGIVSFGKKYCGNSVAVYTNIWEYRDWISEHIKP